MTLLYLNFRGAFLPSILSSSGSARGHIMSEVLYASCVFEVIQGQYLFSGCSLTAQLRTSGQPFRLNIAPLQ